MLEDFTDQSFVSLYGVSREHLREAIENYNKAVKEKNKEGRELYGEDYKPLKKIKADDYIENLQERGATMKSVENALEYFENFAESENEYIDEDGKVYEKNTFERAKENITRVNRTRGQLRHRYGIGTDTATNRQISNTGIGLANRMDTRTQAQDFGLFAKRLEEAALYSVSGYEEQYKRNMLLAIENELKKEGDPKLYKAVYEGIEAIPARDLLQAYIEGDLYLDFDFVYGGEGVQARLTKLKASIDSLLGQLHTAEPYKQQAKELEKSVKKAEKQSAANGAKAKKESPKQPEKKTPKQPAKATPKVKLKMPTTHEPPEHQKKKRKKKRRTKKLVDK